MSDAGEGERRPPTRCTQPGEAAPEAPSRRLASLLSSPHPAGNGKGLMAEVHIDRGTTALRAYEPDCGTLHSLVPVDGRTDVTACSHPEVVVR